MKQINKIPNIILYSMNKKDAIGVLRNISGFNCNYYFNAASQITFEIPKKVYDNDRFEWVDNPQYDNIEIDKLLYLSDSTEQYKFNGSHILQDNQYYIKPLADTTPRTNGTESYPPMKYNANNGISGFKVQEETLLYDLGISEGYTWDWKRYIDITNNYSVQNANTETVLHTDYENWKHLCCDYYIPIENGDIIALRSGLRGKPYFAYRKYFYLDDDSTTGLGSLDEDNSYIQSNPVSRTNVSTAQFVIKRKISQVTATTNGTITAIDTEGTPYDVAVAEDKHSSGIRGTSNGDVFTAKDPNDIVAGKTYYVAYSVKVDTNTSKSGYIKFDCVDVKATKKTKNGTTTWTWHLMPKDYVQIYSGLRNVTEFNVAKKEPYSVKQVWWVITSVSEEKDGINTIKTVTAKSYEYTLSKKTFSISEGIQPLFIPDKINKLITSSDWRTDVWISNNTKYQTKAPQRCNRGLLNQILDYLPEWSIGYVDSNLDFSNNPISSLCCKYRNFDDTDNENLYSFLLNEVEKAYQCFFIFDSENMTINIVNGNPTSINSYGAPKEEGKVGSASNIALTWSNAIKNTNIQTTEDRIVTALRVHTADDKYSMSLINPTGNNILYNFSAYKSQMQYVADTSKNRTLWEAITLWQREYNSVLSNYQNIGKTYIQNILDVIKNESTMSEALAEYRSVADKINVAAESSGVGIRYTDFPIRPQILNLDVTESWRKNYIQDLYSASKNYWEASETRDTNVAIRDANYAALKNRNIYLTIDYKTAVDSNGYSFLSPQEVLELQKFIVEGDWTNENAIFSDDYSATDIVNTLKSVYTEAQNDHNNYISQQCYEFDVTSINIMALDGFANNIDDLTLGRMVSLQVDSGDWQFPILMGYHIDYSDDNNFEMTFDTNYSNKSIQKRFAKLFGAISQTSVNSNSYTFEN